MYDITSYRQFSLIIWNSFFAVKNNQKTEKIITIGYFKKLHNMVFKHGKTSKENGHDPLTNGKIILICTTFFG